MRRAFRVARALGLLVVVSAASAALGQELAVVVRVDRKVDLTLQEIAQIYLKKRRFWEDGNAIVPINRDAGSSPRELFQRLVFGTDTRRLSVYWNREYFRGVLPPATLASDEAVRRFVANEPRAIGYLPPDAVDDTVRVVLTLGRARAPSP